MLAGRGDFGGAQWRAVRFLAAPSVGRSPGDGGPAADQGGAGKGAGLFDGLVDRVGVVAVHVGNDMPTETFETLWPRSRLNQPLTGPSMEMPLLS